MKLPPITVSNRRAATVQLETAIKLYFENRDLISAYTLASAADGILEGIWKHEQTAITERREAEGKPVRFTLNGEFARRLNPDVKPKEGFEYLYKAQNFFKHADTFYNQELVFYSVEHTGLRIFTTIASYNLIYEQITPAMNVFFSWYAVFNPNILGEGNPLLALLEAHPISQTFCSPADLASLGYSNLQKNCPELFTLHTIDEFISF